MAGFEDGEINLTKWCGYTTRLEPISWIIAEEKLTNPRPAAGQFFSKWLKIVVAFLYCTSQPALHPSSKASSAVISPLGTIL